jgi:hypothetical protein
LRSSLDSFHKDLWPGWVYSFEMVDAYVFLEDRGGTAERETSLWNCEVAAIVEVVYGVCLDVSVPGTIGILTRTHRQDGNTDCSPTSSVSSYWSFTS